MLEAWFYTLTSVLVVSIVSLVGVIILGISSSKLKVVLIYLLAFSAGALFGDVFLHIIPEMGEEGFSLVSSIWILAGFLLFFVIEKFVHWQHCHMPITKNHIHPFAYTNLIGDGFHNFLDGLIIAAGYLVSLPIGIATTLAVIFHEIPQEIGDFGVMIHGGFSKGKALFLNFVSALLAVLGAVIGLILSTRIEYIADILLPLAAGGFIYIAGADLIPELHKDVGIRKAFLQLIALLAGIGVMALLLLLE
ncbi:ZIP family metal transporter [Candidatus Pacearchaeota archaeon CG1_02_32_132]|nr:MAG: ZIP family metal transporter [Candidatus Pacearchaeota archaeon CG1_02_32_132]